MFPSNAQCMMSIQKELCVCVCVCNNYVCIDYAIRMCRNICEKCFQNVKIWHELSILPTIRHSNLLIHFIIFSSLFTLCSIPFLLNSCCVSWVSVCVLDLLLEFRTPWKWARNRTVYENMKSKMKWVDIHVHCGSEWVGRVWLFLSWPLLLLLLLFVLLLL